jgi:hypothetical protein
MQSESQLAATEVRAFELCSGRGEIKTWLLFKLEYKVKSTTQEEVVEDNKNSDLPTEALSVFSI